MSAYRDRCRCGCDQHNRGRCVACGDWFPPAPLTADELEAMEVGPCLENGQRREVTDERGTVHVLRLDDCAGA